MKTRTIVTVLGCLAFVLMARGEGGGASQKSLVVKVSDRSEKVTYEVMTPEDFKNLQTQIAQEAKLHTKVMMAAETAWKQDETTKKKAFPRAAIAMRKAQVLKEFTDAAKATDAAGVYEDRDSDKAESGKTRQEERDKNNKKSKEQIDKDKRRESDKEYLYNAARNLYDTKLNDIMAAAQGGGEKAGEAKPGAAKE